MFFSSVDFLFFDFPSVMVFIFNKAPVLRFLYLEKPKWLRFLWAFFLYYVFFLFFCFYFFYSFFLAFRFCSKVVYVDRMSMECLELLPVWSAVGYPRLGIAHYKAKQF